ncbi:MAG: DUF1016 family protein [Phycisphaerae bacterium]|nr:DUF1016 family protein [Phycisphaerae bacterium]
MKKARGSEIALPDYERFIETLKGRVAAARLSVARAVNRDMILLYWDIGQAILEKQETLGWGDSVVEMVAKDLRQAFPGSKGFSPQNVWRMLQFYRTHTASEFLSQVVREMILCAEKDDVEVEYALKTKQNPIGVAEYQLQSMLPADLKGKLPTARQLADVVRTALPAKGGRK